MNDLLNAVMGQLDERTLAGLGRQVGADPHATRNAVAASLPLLLGAMQRNAGAGGADALARALERDHANASVDDRLDAALSGANTLDGAAILGHVLGGRQQRAALGVSKVSGLEPGQSGKLMAMLAPLVMAVLANMQRRQGAAGGSGIEGLLGQVMGGLGGAGAGAQGGSGVSGLLGAVLDRDGDGDVDFQDLMAAGSAGSGGSGGGLDGLLGGLLGGRR